MLNIAVPVASVTVIQSARTNRDVSVRSDREAFPRTVGFHGVACTLTERVVHERILRSEKHDTEKGGDAERDHEALSQRVQDPEGLARDLQDRHLLFLGVFPLS